MLNALFAFEDRSAGEAAAKSLERADLASARVEVHVHNASATEPVTSGVDEFATGGFIHTFSRCSKVSSIGVAPRTTHRPMRAPSAAAVPWSA